MVLLFIVMFITPLPQSAKNENWCERECLRKQCQFFFYVALTNYS